MQRSRTTHKVCIETEHLRPHFDHSCHCYSFQDACPACSFKRAINASTHEVKVTEEEILGIRFFIHGTEYLPTNELDDYIQSFFKPIRNHRPNEAVLLFKDNKTVDIREFAN